MTLLGSYSREATASSRQHYDRMALLTRINSFTNDGPTSSALPLRMTARYCYRGPFPNVPVKVSRVLDSLSADAYAARTQRLWIEGSNMPENHSKGLP
jgi:hypothetical protein